MGGQNTSDQFCAQFTLKIQKLAMLIAEIAEEREHSIHDEALFLTQELDKYMRSFNGLIDLIYQDPNCSGAAAFAIDLVHLHRIFGSVVNGLRKLSVEMLKYPRLAEANVTDRSFPSTMAFLDLTLMFQGLLNKMISEHGDLERRGNNVNIAAVGSSTGQVAANVARDQIQTAPQGTITSQPDSFERLLKDIEGLTADPSVKEELIALDRDLQSAEPSKKPTVIKDIALWIMKNPKRLGSALEKVMEWGNALQ